MMSALRNLKRYLGIFRFEEKKALLIFGLLQAAVGVLDLVGVGMLGIAGALSIRVISGLAPGDRVNRFLHHLPVPEMSTLNYVLLFLLGSSLLLMSKTIISAILSNFTLRYVARVNKRISDETIHLVYSDLAGTFQKYSAQERVYYTTDGLENLTVGIAGAFLALIADLTVLFSLALALLIVDYKTTLATLTIFGITGIVSTKILGRAAAQVGGEVNRLSISSATKIIELEKSYKTLKVSGRIPNFIEQILEIRDQTILLSSKKAFLPNLSKYLIELIMVLGTLTVSLLQLFFNSALHAAGSLSIFIASISRIAPATLRLQQGAILIKGNVRAASKTLDFLDLTKEVEGNPLQRVRFNQLKNPESYKIQVTDLNFTYAGNGTFKFSEVNFELEENDFMVLNGRSGAGKSTLVDLLLGVRKPSSGSITVGGIPIGDCIHKFPGSIYYVPQESVYIDASLRENLLFGFHQSEVPESILNDALKKVGLYNLLSSDTLGFDQLIGTGGRQLSGGQLQRLAIARALLASPKILFLDEPTSSLDPESENIISRLLKDLNSSMTIILISHRDRTIEYANKLMSIDNGKITHFGPIDQERKS